MQTHIPVLAKEVLNGLNLSSGDTILDATLGLGGHATLILNEVGKTGRLIGFDKDVRNLEIAQKALSGFDNVTYVHDSFGNIEQRELQHIDSALFDLGISSPHVDDPSRGFSFRNEGPLDMRYDQTQDLTAETIVNSWSQEELEDLFRIYGEEPRAREIAKTITHARRKNRILTTAALASLVEGVVRRSGRLHPATRIFQALRMEVNDELGEIERGIPAVVNLLKSGGRIAVISFHSLEDRLVKQLFKTNSALNIITKKVIQASFEEKRSNPRARSAKLRVAEKQ
ncbi:MAG: 16S rRNA (cytosine(1402)-N(4))-methyltransferase RsmH [Candidatus Uhrbacteria bacterium]|nr:16S rRNA (cytosine(1402)-N(4))-methyltransferase RsmH [Candidatus Uhrbacteria bacterium]